MSSDDRKELGDRLRAIEEACRAHDSGNGAEATGMAADLAALFEAAAGSSSLLARLGGTYTRLASSVPKPPHPAGAFLPLIDVTLDLAGSSQGFTTQATTGPTGLASSPRCQARLGRASTFRQVQAPDWWKNEAVFALDHSKVTRRDLVVGPRSPLPPILIGLNYGVVIEVPWEAARPAAIRQIAHELVASPELRKLADRPAR